jgi:hydrogenase nickel incorporation protein HypA/HybF
MHEFSVAQEIIKSVLREAENHAAKKIIKIELEIGTITFLNPEQVTFWVEQGMKGTVGEGTEIVVREIEPEIRCEDCGFVGKLRVEEDPKYHFTLPVFLCPACDSRKITITKGRETLLKRMEIDA